MSAGVLPMRELLSTRVGIWRFALAPFVFGAALRLLLVTLVQDLHGNFLFLDDQGYDRIGWSLAQSWHMHVYPSPEATAVTSSYLYYVFVAGVYFFFGHHWVLVKLLGALLSALSVPAAASVGESLGGRRLGIKAAWLSALYPSAIFWGATGLKDGPMATLLLAVAAIVLRPLTMRRLACMVALLVIAFLTRPVEGVIGIAMLVAPAIALMRSRWHDPRQPVQKGSRLLILLVGIPAASVLLVFQATRYLPTLMASLAGESTLSLRTVPVAITFSPSPFELLHALLSPVQWFGPATDVAYVPGMFVWTLMLPAVALGCWDLLRRGSGPARGLVVSTLVFLYLYTCVFQSQGFSRQRFTVEILLLVISLYAFDRIPRLTAACTAVCACVVVPAQLVLAGALSLPILTLLTIVIGAVWLGAGLVRSTRIRRAIPKHENRRYTLEGTNADGGHKGPESELKLALTHATSTGVRVVALRLSGYGVGFVASILIARAVGPTGRGLYAYPVALVGFVMNLGHLGLELAQVHLAAQGKDLRRMWADSTVFSVAAGVVGWVVVAVAVMVDPRVANGLPLSWIAIPMGLVPLLLMTLYWVSLLQLDGRLVVATWASWIGVALQAVAIVGMFCMHELTPFRVLMLQWLINGSAWLVLLIACRRAGLVTLRVDSALLRRSLKFGLKAYVAQTFFYLVLRVDQVLVAHYAGYRQLGLYALATTVAELLWLLTDPLAGALMPHMVRAQAGDDRRLSFSTARLSLWILIAAAVGVWVLAPFALPIVYGTGFADAVPALRLLLPGVVALGAAKSLGSMLVKEGRMLMTSALGLCALGLNLTLNVMLLPRIGILGASIASSASYAVLAISYVIISRRRGVAGWKDLAPRASDLYLLSRGRPKRDSLIPSARAQIPLDNQDAPSARLVGPRSTQNR